MDVEMGRRMKDRVSGKFRTQRSDGERKHLTPGELRSERYPDSVAVPEGNLDQGTLSFSSDSKARYMPWQQLLVYLLASAP
jgi:hypothetical protein